MTATRQGAAQALPAPGAVIGGKYEVVKVLGEGGMGVVFEANHLRLRQRVALKMLRPEMLEHEVVVTRFAREARAAGQLRNRHAARVMDVDQTAEGMPFMVMELLEGHDLQALLESHGKLPFEEVVDYVLQACAAMIEAHQLGIVHRDLKPANLFLAVDGAEQVVKVLDFGISKIHTEGDPKLTSAENVMGTAMYMSPEQIRSPENVDARTDIWSLGVILYELLAGRPPWLGSATQIAAGIVSEDPPGIQTFVELPRELAAVVTKALKREPSERFADVKELAIALAPFAPAAGPGRVVAESVAGTSTRIRREPRAVSEITAAPSEPGANGVSGATAPGWSQHSSGESRHRTALFVLLVTFVVGLVVAAGAAAVWMRSRVRAISDPSPVVATATPPVTPASTASAPTLAVSASAAAVSTASTASPVEPGAAGSGSAPAVSSSSSAKGPRSSAIAKPTATATATARPPPPHPKGTASPIDNPLTL